MGLKLFFQLMIKSNPGFFNIVKDDVEIGAKIDVSVGLLFKEQFIDDNDMLLNLINGISNSATAYKKLLNEIINFKFNSYDQLNNRKQDYQTINEDLQYLKLFGSYLFRCGLRNQYDYIKTKFEELLEQSSGWGRPPSQWPTKKYYRDANLLSSLINIEQHIKIAFLENNSFKFDNVLNYKGIVISYYIKALKCKDFEGEFIERLDKYLYYFLDALFSNFYFIQPILGEDFYKYYRNDLVFMKKIYEYKSFSPIFSINDPKQQISYFSRAKIRNTIKDINEFLCLCLKRKEQNTQAA